MQALKEWKGPSLQSPSMQVNAAAVCLKLRPAIEGGDGSSVLEAVAQCAAHGLLMPSWLAAFFVERFQRVVSGACKGWSDEEAFGSIVPAGKNIAGIRASSQTSPWAYEVATQLLCDDPARPIDVSLYEEVGVKIDRKATQVQTLIANHCEDRLFPSLSYIKDRLKAGRDLLGTYDDWALICINQQLQGIGWEQCLDGELRRINPKKTQ
ncbi:hypothetical protein [Rhodoferax sp.]|uniref:hypothetical protein n=1 Tax=Rhodoferax sp. TaxID=50421 RepID=UPI00374DC974